MQVLQCLKEGKVNASCRLNSTCKHRGCYLAWEVGKERLLTIRDTTGLLKSTIALVAHQLQLHECAELGIQAKAPSQVP